MANHTQRLRDPVHGLIVFDEGDRIDMLAWDLLQTPEFQRLRRIRQLGVSEMVFPGATHTRFAHSVGVYHNARKLMRVVRQAAGGGFDEDRAAAVLLAALLHDLGHGPFSHAFEGARETIAEKRGIDTIEKHEKTTRGFERLTRCADTYARDLAARLLNRRRLKALDLREACGLQVAPSLSAEKRLESHLADRIGVTVFKDDPGYNLYSLSDGDAVKAHKVVRVRTAEGKPEEITKFPDTIISKTLTQKIKLVRYYFLSDDDRDEAERKMRGR